MFVLLSVSLILIIYVRTFKNEFTEEHIDKITPVIAIVASLFIISFILGLMGWGV